MSAICEHEFEQEDPNNPGYSITEFDLVDRLNMSLRKNLKEGVYEIVSSDTGDVLFAYERLPDAASKANELEGTDFIKLHCGPFCPRRGSGYL